MEKNRAGSHYMQNKLKHVVKNIKKKKLLCSPPLHGQYQRTCLFCFCVDYLSPSLTLSY